MNLQENIRRIKEVMGLDDSEMIKEDFSFANVKNFFDFLVNLHTKKYPGADSLERLSMIKAFQKWVDLLYRFTKKSVEFDGVESIKVGTVWKSPWGSSFSSPELPPTRLDFFVRLYPKLDNSNPPKNKEKFNIQYKEFQKEFEHLASMINLDSIQPVQDKKIKKIKNFIHSICWVKRVIQDIKVIYIYNLIFFKVYYLIFYFFLTLSSFFFTLATSILCCHLNNLQSLLFLF